MLGGGVHAGKKNVSYLSIVWIQVGPESELVNFRQKRGCLPVTKQNDMARPSALNASKVGMAHPERYGFTQTGRFYVRKTQCSQHECLCTVSGVSLGTGHWADGPLVRQACWSDNKYKK